MTVGLGEKGRGGGSSPVLALDLAGSDRGDEDRSEGSPFLDLNSDPEHGSSPDSADTDDISVCEAPSLPQKTRMKPGPLEKSIFEEIEMLVNETAQRFDAINDKFPAADSMKMGKAFMRLLTPLVSPGSSHSQINFWNVF